MLRTQFMKLTLILKWHFTFLGKLLRNNGNASILWSYMECGIKFYACFLFLDYERY